MFIKLFFRGTDETFSKPLNEKVETKFDTLILDPNISIKQNYSKIKNLLSLYKENNYTEYVITVEGHYVYGKHVSYDYPIGIIYVNDKDLPCTLSEQIIYNLTRLYAHSLGKKFQVQDEGSECFIVKSVNCTYFYRLRSDSPLYKKIQDKVVEEINQINNV